MQSSTKLWISLCVIQPIFQLKKMKFGIFPISSMRYFLRVFSICIYFLLAACAHKDQNFDTLQSVQNVQQDNAKNQDYSLKTAAIQDTAMSFGAQAGLEYKAKIINSALNNNAQNLDRIFNFNLLIVDKNILPPVIERGDASLKLDDIDTMRIADRTYKILTPARFVTAVPTWRDYLFMNYSKVERPDNGLLPKDSASRKIWKKYAKLGWDNGCKQADDLYADNLNRLKRDFVGMSMYRKLLLQKMVTLPKVSVSRMGITGDKDNLRINDEIIKIDKTPALIRDSKKWRTTTY